MSKRLGYIVVTFNPPRRPYAHLLYDDQDKATAARDTMIAGPGDRHVVAEVIQVDDEEAR